jgi:hypothetical protein
MAGTPIIRAIKAIGDTFSFLETEIDGKGAGLVGPPLNY